MLALCCYFVAKLRLFAIRAKKDITKIASLFGKDAIRKQLLLFLCNL